MINIFVIFKNYFMSAHWILDIANEARKAELAISNLISNMWERNNRFNKTAPKYRKLDETKNKNAPKSCVCLPYLQSMV